MLDELEAAHDRDMKDMMEQVYSIQLEAYQTGRAQGEIVGYHRAIEQLQDSKLTQSDLDRARKGLVH